MEMMKFQNKIGLSSYWHRSELTKDIAQWSFIKEQNRNGKEEDSSCHQEQIDIDLYHKKER